MISIGYDFFEKQLCEKNIPIVAVYRFIIQSLISPRIAGDSMRKTPPRILRYMETVMLPLLIATIN